jgi:hypothetical protein
MIKQFIKRQQTRQRVKIREESPKSSSRDLIKDTAKSIAKNLNKVISQDSFNDIGKDPSKDSSSFYGPGPPSISLEEYIYRLIKGLNGAHDDESLLNSIGVRSVLIGLIYINRLNDFSYDSMNVHRIVMVATFIAVKYLEDDHLSNKSLAKLAGIPIEELNELEVKFCVKSFFNFTISASELESIQKILTKDLGL